ncbi:MAG: LacI family transcriptional regulator [Clostridiales bacterium]|nr:LacI family transcriptional regulator [Clostridiales bacterium]
MKISEVAVLAGVSPAAVSRYFNGGYLSDEKKKKIEEVVSKTGYVPSSSAQSLRTKKNLIIGVIVPKISSESVSKMVNGITKALEGSKYSLILANTDNAYDKEVDYLNIFQTGNVDGVILTATIFTQAHYKAMKKLGKPLVVLSQYTEKFSCVYNDYFHGAYYAVRHLIDKGCRKIAYIGVTKKDQAAGQSRYEGYIKALSDNGIKPDPIIIKEGTFNLDSGTARMKDILEVEPHIDGVFCATDSLAIGAMKVIKEFGLSVPDDIKIIGTGNTQMSELVTPSLSTVKLYYETAGEEACKLLLEMMQGEDVFKQLRLGYRVIERESTNVKQV